jgi:hypothetical protein
LYLNHAVFDGIGGFRMTTEKLIKSLENPRFKIQLFETNDKYVITYENNQHHGINYSEAIQDYKMAAYLFDLKVAELEGN